MVVDNNTCIYYIGIRKNGRIEIKFNMVVYSDVYYIIQDCDLNWNMNLNKLRCVQSHS